MCFVIYCNQLRHRKLSNSGLFRYSPAEDTYIIYRTTTKKTVWKRINQISEIMQTPTYILNALSCYIWAVTCDFQQCGILTSVNSDEPLQPHFKLRNSKWCSVSSLTIIEYSSDEQRLWSDCAYAQADLRLCWSHHNIIGNHMHWLSYRYHRQSITLWLNL